MTEAAKQNCKLLFTYCLVHEVNIKYMLKTIAYYLKIMLVNPSKEQQLFQLECYFLCISYVCVFWMEF